MTGSKPPDLAIVAILMLIVAALVIRAYFIVYIE